MRVAIVINSSWNIYNFRKNLIQSLLDRGDEVIAIAPPDAYSKKLSDMGCEFYPVSMNTTGVNPFRDLFLLLRLIGIYRKVNADVYLHYTIKPGIYGTLAARITGSKPVVNNVSGLGTVFLQNNWVLSVAAFLYRISFMHADHIFFQNNSDKMMFLSLIHLRRPTISVIPGSGVDYHRFSPRDDTNGQFTFIMISRLLVDKGVREYVEAASILKSRGIKARFILLGQIERKHMRGVSEDEIDKWTREHLVEYVGVSDRVEEWIAKAHVVVLPSYREGIPKTLLEGAAMSRPLIATDVPGCNSVVIDNITGFLCEEKSAGSLAQSMEKMIAISPERRAMMGENGRHHVIANFDERLVISDYLQKIDRFAPSLVITSPALKAAYG